MNLLNDDIILKNEKLEARIHLHGAELASLKRTDLDRQYLWNADPSFWNRSSPVLFPFVGSVKDKKFRYEGKEYDMGQHGFARDMDFECTSQTAEEAWFKLESNEETMARYPLPFCLEIGYKLTENNIKVMWKVSNPAEKDLHFSIGAHPAFLCPIHEGTKHTDYSFQFLDREGKPMESFLTNTLGGGLVLNKWDKIDLEEDGILPYADNLFDIDTLVLENGQAGAVAILDQNKEAYIKVSFDAPVVGIWSPPGKHAPFACIEPWYGRCDSQEFVGELKDREWSNCLKIDEIFEASYVITLN